MKLISNLTKHYGLEIHCLFSPNLEKSDADSVKHYITLYVDCFDCYLSPLGDEAIKNCFCRLRSAKKSSCEPLSVRMLIV